MSIVSLESADEKNVSASILNFLTAYYARDMLTKQILGCRQAKAAEIAV